VRSTVLRGPGDVRLEDRPDPDLVEETDAIVRVTAACVCGSDLWAYRGVAKRDPGQPLGHEFLGVVARVGGAVGSVLPGDRVVAPFSWSDGTCWQCRAGLTSSCPQGGFWGRSPVGGAQAELIRVPHADGTLVVIPPGTPERLDPAILALGDVLATGHHAVRCAAVTAGATVAVVGDGAVGLCAVLAARRAGAAEVLLLSRHAARAEIGQRFGARVLPAPDEQTAVAAVRDNTRGRGADAVLECVGTEESLRTAVSAARDGGSVGFVGVPHGVDRLPVGRMFGRNIGVRGGIAHARAYLPELLADVLSGRLDPAPVFDVTMPLSDVTKAYHLMDTRRAVKVLLRP
jgi:threonine dehydrogenase-like Zn-dependent dehydrogenase